MVNVGIAAWELHVIARDRRNRGVVSDHCFLLREIISAWLAERSCAWHVKRALADCPHRSGSLLFAAVGFSELLTANC